MTDINIFYFLKLNPFQLEKVLIYQIGTELIYSRFNFTLNHNFSIIELVQFFKLSTRNKYWQKKQTISWDVE